MTKEKTKKKESRPSSLWHYTSFENLTFILNLKDESCAYKGLLNFWFSNPLQTNDKKELNFFKEHIYNGKKGEQIKKEIEFIEGKIGSPFTLSLIRHYDAHYPSCEIPMWRMYGDNFNGVRLRFNYKELEKYCQNHELELAQCIYPTKEEMSSTSRDIRNSYEAEDLNTLETIYKKTVCYKTRDWVYENEWRLVKWCNNIEDIGFRPKDGRLYHEVKIPIDLLETIVIGPKADQDAIEGCLNLIKDKLKNKKINANFNIEKSKLQIEYV